MLERNKSQGKPFCVTEKQVDGKPIVFNYRNYDLFLYKPDYDDEDELVESASKSLYLECTDFYHFAFGIEIHGSKCQGYCIFLMSK